MNEAKLSLNMGLAWPEVEHFYAVGHRGQTAGRIWFATDRCGEDEPWEWHLCLPMTLPDDSLGRARSKEEALQMLGNSLHTLLLQVPLDRIERAFRLSAATGLDFTSGETVELSVEEITRPVVLAPEQHRAAQTEVLAAAAQAIAVPEPPAEPSPAVAPLSPQIGRQKVNVVRRRMSVVKVTTGTFERPGTPSAAPQPATVVESPVPMPR